MAKRYSQAEVTQQITEFNARSNKFLVLLTGSTGLVAQPTMSQLVAVEIATDTTGYPTRPAVTLGTPTVDAGVSITATVNFVISATSAMSYDGYAIIYGGTNARGNTTGTIAFIDDTIGTVSLSGGQVGTLQVNLTKLFALT